MEINRLIKDIKRLSSKGMSNTDLKVTIETFSKFPIFWVEKSCHQVSFGELQSRIYY